LFEIWRSELDEWLLVEEKADEDEAELNEDEVGEGLAEAEGDRLVPMLLPEAASTLTGWLVMFVADREDVGDGL
jgi:hypothetical protein